MDSSRDEMLAMFDAFVGEDFPTDKKESVISLQQNLHRGQSLLAKQLDDQVLTEEEYVDRFNDLLSAVFKACENVLGKEAFEALFGLPRTEAQGYIDKQKFLESRGQKRATPSASPVKRPATAHKHKFVLIVDESNHYQTLNKRLEREGCQVMRVGSGWAALEALQSHHPDLMVVDLDTPTMSGYELVDIVHRRPQTASVRVVLLSAKITETTRAEAASVGASRIVSKATTPDELATLINRSLAH